MLFGGRGDRNPVAMCAFIQYRRFYHLQKVRGREEGLFVRKEEESFWLVVVLFLLFVWLFVLVEPMYIYTHAVYPRQSWERVFKQLYNIGLVLNYGAFIITFVDYYSRLKNTFNDYWGDNNFNLYPSLNEVLANCTYPGSFSVNGIHTTTELTLASTPYMFVTFSSFFWGYLAAHGLVTICDFVAKGFFALNIRHFRYRGLQVPIQNILIAFMFACSVAVISCFGVVQPTRKLLNDYVETCTTRFILTQGDKYVGAEYDTDTIFGTSMVLILIATCVNLFFYFLALIHLITYGMKEENSRLLQLKTPWEEGFFCRPNKPVLVRWCEDRKRREEEVMGPGYEALRLQSLGRDPDDIELQQRKQLMEQQQFFGVEDGAYPDEQEQEEYQDNAYDEGEGDDGGADQEEEEEEEEGHRHHRHHRHRSDPQRSHRHRRHGRKSDEAAGPATPARDSGQTIEIPAAPTPT